MVINDFSSLIEISATLSIAFVAVEYAKSFTNVLCKRFFMYEAFIYNTFKRCYDILPDNETLEHISPQSIDGRNTNIVIEDIKRRNENMRKTLKNEGEMAKKEIIDSCQAKSISSLSFFIFIFDILLLFMGGIESEFMNFVPIYVAISCFLSIIYILLGWVFGEKGRQNKYLNFQSLKYNTFLSIVIVVLSILSTITILFWVGNPLNLIRIIWKPLFIIWVILSFVHFCVYVLKIRNNAKQIKKNVIRKAVEFECKCKEIEQDTSKLLAINEVSAMLETY